MTGVWKLKGCGLDEAEEGSDLCRSCGQAPLLLGSKEQVLRVKGSELVPTT